MASLHELMKTAAVVLALLVAGTQSLVAADCCCIIVCQRHSEVCSKCTHQGALNAGAVGATDCCRTHHEGGAAPTESGEKRCSHLEPSSEVVVQAADAFTAPPTLVLDLPPARDPAPSEADQPDGLVCPARGSPPLHLLFSVLLI